MSLSTRVLIGLFLGVMVGIFFGEMVGFLEDVGLVYIRLLQMTVIPYIFVSLILALGRLDRAEIKVLAVRAGLLMLVIWVVVMGLVMLAPLTFPQWQSASFFSASVVQVPDPVNLIELYIPANPFHSLANTIVPAIVLFSIVVGVALTGIRDKDRLLDVLSVIADSLSAIARFVVRLAPLGVFCLMAAAAGTMSVEMLAKMQVYLVAYVLIWVVAAFWLLPGLVAAITPLRYRDVVGPARDALVTAFGVGSLLVVLPIISMSAKKTLDRGGVTGEKRDSIVDVIVPACFSFPTAGILLSGIFILFAAWFIDHPLAAAQYPAFGFSAVIAFFGASTISVPFLLDLYQLPADMFNIFVLSNTLTVRFAVLLATMHILVLAVLVSWAVTRGLQFRWDRIVRYLGFSVVLVAVVIVGGRAFLRTGIHFEYRQYQQFIEMDLMTDRVNSTIRDSSAPIDGSTEPTNGLDRVTQRGVLRVGYFPDGLPYVFRNAQGRMVGLDVELLHQFAGDLNVTLEFVRIDRNEVSDRLNDGAVDIVMSGLGMTSGHAMQVEYSRPYQYQTLAMVVKDYRRRDFSDRVTVQAMPQLRVAIPATSYYMKHAASFLPQAELVPLQSPRTFFRDEAGDVDAMIFPAEAGSAWTLVYPAFSVTVLHPSKIRIPLVAAVRRGDRDFVEIVNRWFELREADGTIDGAYERWILGHDDAPRAPRWSVIRDVLGWVS